MNVLFTRLVYRIFSGGVNGLFGNPAAIFFPFRDHLSGACHSVVLFVIIPASTIFSSLSSNRGPAVFRRLFAMLVIFIVRLPT